MEAQIQQTGNLPTKPKRKSYYKSRKKEYSWDSQHKQWYFMVANDPDKIKFCYASGAIQIIGGIELIAGIETYRLHKPGSVMMRYSLILQMAQYLKNPDHQWGSKVIELKNSANLFKLEAEKQFTDKCGNEVEALNDMILDFMAKNRIVRI